MDTKEKLDADKYIHILQHKFESILGTEGLDFSLKYMSNDEHLFIEKITWNFRTLTDGFENALRFLITILAEYFPTYKKANNSLEKSIVIDNICDIFIYCLILNTTDKNSRDYVQMNKLKAFINDLVNLASQTYEQRICTASFILIKPTWAAENILHNLNIDFILFEEKDYINIPDISKYSRAYRLVDGLSLSYVINSDYQIIGIAKKRKSHQSIKEICSTMTDNRLQFIYLNNKKIYWHLDKDRVLLSENFQWKLKDYNVIKSILKGIIADSHSQTNGTFDSQIQILCNVIKDLSNTNTGALFAILDDNFYFEGKLRKYRDKTILNEILVSEKAETANLYKKVITNQTDNISIKQNIDPYLVKLIADVDGAVILNKKLKILDFGRMIQPQNIDDSTANKKPKKIFSEKFIKLPENKFTGIQGTLDEVAGGARSIATFHASTFGLAIKISEDGGITIYQRRKLIFKL